MRRFLEAGTSRCRLGGGRRRTQSGVTLVELLVSVLIVSFAIGSLVAGYILAAEKVDYSTTAGAAQRMVHDRVEQVRSARWDVRARPLVNELTNLAGIETVVLDVPRGGTNVLTATRRTLLTLVSSSPPLYAIRVECVWSVPDRGPFTNWLLTYRAPDS